VLLWNLFRNLFDCFREINAQIMVDPHGEIEKVKLGSKIIGFLVFFKKNLARMLSILII
jgi:hypothetical protein